VVRTGSSVSVSVSPAPRSPGVVVIPFGSPPPLRRTPFEFLLCVCICTGAEEDADDEEDAVKSIPPDPLLPFILPPRPKSSESEEDEQAGDGGEVQYRCVVSAGW
jgi:hypothetical protein